MAKAQEFGGTRVGSIQLSSVLQKSPQWISKLTREGILVQGDDRKYHLAETIAAYIDHVTGASETSKEPKRSDYEREIAGLKREKAQIELNELKKNIHYTEDVTLLVSDMIIKAKTKLLAIPVRVAPKVQNEPAHVIEAELEREIYAALESLSNYDPADLKREGGEGDDSEGYEEDEDSI